MISLTAMLTEFHARYDPPSGSVPGWELNAERKKFLTDELEELDLAVLSGQRHHIAKKIADVIYVLAGTAHHWGIDVDAALEAVHVSNMTKDVSVAQGRKAIKGKAYKPADMSRACGAIVVEANGGH